MHIRVARSGLGWSLSDFARHSGVSRRTIATFETGGKVSEETLAALRGALCKAGIGLIDDPNRIGVTVPRPRDADGTALIPLCRMARSALGWRASDLALESGLSKSTVARFETRGQVTGETLATLRKALAKGGAALVESGDRLGVTVSRACAAQKDCH